MAKSKKRQIYCFLNSERPCTLNCRASYKGGKEIYCRIIWSIQKFGYMASAAEEKIRKGTKKSKENK